MKLKSEKSKWKMVQNGIPCAEMPTVASIFFFYFPPFSFHFVPTGLAFSFSFLCMLKIAAQQSLFFCATFKSTSQHIVLASEIMQITDFLVTILEIH